MYNTHILNFLHVTHFDKMGYKSAVYKQAVRRPYRGRPTLSTPQFLLATRPLANSRTASLYHQKTTKTSF